MRRWWLWIESLNSRGQLTVINSTNINKINSHLSLKESLNNRGQVTVNNSTNINKGNAKRGISPCLNIWPGDLDIWPWKSIGFQILLRTKYVPSLVKIHWRPLKDVDSRVFTRMLRGKYLTRSPWPWNSIGFQILLRTKFVPSLVKIHWRPLKDVDSRVFTRMLCGKNLTWWPWPLT
jgi:hypothetical protein